MRIQSVMIVAGCLLLQASVAGAYPSLPDAVIAQYPDATNLDTCGTCHTSFTSAPGLNPYGQSYKDVSTGFSLPSEILAAIELADSDGDGIPNIEEISTDAGFFPGWTCETYTSAENPPSNLADLVDPADPGCNGSSTSTVPVSTTTTTLTAPPACSQPVSAGSAPVATDCLFILQAAVGTQICSSECVCAPTGTLPAKATDALLCLRHSVGDDSVPLQCPCGA